MISHFYYQIIFPLLPVIIMKKDFQLVAQYYRTLQQGKTRSAKRLLLQEINPCIIFFVVHFLLMDFTLQPHSATKKKQNKPKQKKSLCNLERAYFVRKGETIKFPLNPPTPHLLDKQTAFEPPASIMYVQHPQCSPENP